MSQATPQSLPFSYGWWSFDLGQYRPCDGTYCYYPYESLPPLPEAQFDGSLQWLEQAIEEGDEDEDDELEELEEVEEEEEDEDELEEDEEEDEDDFEDEEDEEAAWEEEMSARLAALGADAQRMGLTLPEAFLNLMKSPDLQEGVPSCTACYFDLPEKIVPCPGSEAGSIIRFLNDQQDVLMWYLYLTPQGEHCVLVSPYELDTAAEGDEEEGEHEPLTEQQRQSIITNTQVCAPSFEAFLYRFWLENVIWFKLNGGGGERFLTDAERQYVAHYRASDGGQ